MRNFRKIFLMAAILLCCVSGSFGLTIEQVCNQLASNPITKGNFIQSKTITSAKGNRELKSNGNFILSLDGIMWDTLKPFPSTLIVTTTSVIQISADGKKSVIDASNNQVFGSIATTLVSVFSNDLTLLNKNFEISFTEQEGGKWQISLEPKDSTIKTVLNTIKLIGVSNKTSTTLTSIEIIESSNSKITYLFENHSYPKELTDDEKTLFELK